MEATSCKKTFLDEIDRKDILAHIQWMQGSLQERVKGGQNRTIRNRLHAALLLLRNDPHLEKEAMYG